MPASRYAETRSYSTSQRKTEIRGVARAQRAPECGRMRAVPARCVPCCMTSGIENDLDAVVRGSEEETLTIADTSA